MSEKYIAIQIKDDGDGHSYIVPNELAEEFSDILENGTEDSDYDVFEQKFDRYRTGGCISLYQLFISESEMKRLTGEK